jgi:hypothetical protein
MHVGFLGLGAIGTPMAAHLARRGPLTVWNRTAARAVEFTTRHGASVAATPREAAAVAEVVVTCLGNSADVAGLLEGPDGLLAGLRPGALLLDCTSGDPATSRRIAERLAARGVAFADAPVSGGTNGAEAGTLTVMVGADAATFARARPVLEAFGRHIEHVGPVGAGDALKAVNQAFLALNIERALVRERGAGAGARAHGRLAAHLPLGAARQGRGDRGRSADANGSAGAGIRAGPRAPRGRPGRAGRGGRLSRPHSPHRAAGRRGDSRLMTTCRAASLSSVSVDPHGQSR